jgi:hypothetical protein
MIIAICFDINQFQTNRIFDAEWAKKFPGALWAAAFAESNENLGCQVVTGDIALSHVRSGYWRAADIVVIQDLDAFHGLELVNLGARPGVLLGFESPMYAFGFYDKLHEFIQRFPHRILFSGAFQDFQLTPGINYQACFPSFSVNDHIPFVPWHERDFLVMVASNKFWKELFKIPLFCNPLRYWPWLKSIFGSLRSMSLAQAIKSELHTKRLEAIEFFGGRKRLCLYGPGWSELQKLPRDWQRRLRQILGNLNPRACDDKIATISGYKFAICYENVIYPGYVTEKIIDCFVAGVVPVYLGAPDIEKHVPVDSFIDMRKFKQFSDLEAYLDQISEEQAQKLLKAGKAFLQSQEGQKYSFTGLATLLTKVIHADQFSV